MTIRARKVKNWSSVSLTTSSQTQSTEIVQPLGDIIGFQWDLTAVATGTLSSANTLLSAIESVVITDGQGRTLFDGVGEDLARVGLWVSKGGKYVTPATISTTSQSWTAQINFPVKLADQNVKVQVTFAPYSDLASSGATGGTVSLTLRAIYGVLRDKAQTMRMYKSTQSVSSGDNSLGSQLPTVSNVNAMAFTVGTEGNITDISLSYDGSVTDISKVGVNYLKDAENDIYISGHQTGMFEFPITPFDVDASKTQLNFNMSSSDTIVIYLFTLE